MPLTLDQIPWGEPLLPAQVDPQWEAQIKRHGGMVGDVDRRVASSDWVREMAARIPRYRPRHMPVRLHQICTLVSAQENACRYCYGANRAFMKMLGYSENFISRLEREAQMAELDRREQECIRFFRNLARSRPRPARSAVESLVAAGFTPLAVAEMAFAVSSAGLYNRLSTFIACRPEHGLEQMARGPLGRVVGLTMPVMRWLARGGRKASGDPEPDASAHQGPFARVLAPLAGLPAHGFLRNSIDGALNSTVLSVPAKALMFAVVARSLGSALCESDARELLAREGMDAQQVEAALSGLEWPGLPASQAGLLAWARSTVYYDTDVIQRETRRLAGAMGDAAVLEAIGVAALANCVVRLGMLSE